LDFFARHRAARRELGAGHQESRFRRDRQVTVRIKHETQERRPRSRGADDYRLWRGADHSADAEFRHWFPRSMMPRLSGNWQLATTLKNQNWRCGEMG